MTNINIFQDGEKTVLQLQQNLVASFVPEVKQELKKVVDKGEVVVVDMKNVSMVDSTGIGLLMAAHNSLRETDKVLEIRNASHEIVKLFKTMSFDRRFIVS